MFIDGENLEIGFNSKYLIDIARQITGANKFMLSDKLSPTFVFDEEDSLTLPFNANAFLETLF